jgi:hypothetical protein
MIVLEHKPYTTAVKTNIAETFRKQIVDGKPYVPASEDPAIIAKWDYYKNLQYLQSNNS